MTESVDYRAAGVNRAEGQRTVSLIKEALDGLADPAAAGQVGAPSGAGVVGDLGGFAALQELPGSPETLLAACTDGVGTKIEVSLRYDRLAEIGQDCVAMCLNDMICHGAKPLFFLDYLACDNLDASRAASIVAGIGAAAARCGAALIGGETAEMPGIYREGSYDVAGFSVGIVEQPAAILPDRIRGNEVLLGLQSSGLHSNGFSLIRRLVKDYDTLWEGSPLCNLLTEPTRLYVAPVLAAARRFDVTGVAHITGGGLPENLPRILPEGVEAVLRPGAIKELPIHRFLRTLPVAEAELYETFNMGVGMVLAVAPGDVDGVTEFLLQQGETVFSIGALRPGIRGLRWEA